MNGRVLVVGSSNTDFVVNVGRLPAAGETLLGGAFFTAAGGKGANQAVAAARAGADVAFIARVGGDDLGRSALAGFSDDGIDCSLVAIDESRASGVAFILVDDAGENSIVVVPGANAGLDVEQVDTAAASGAFGAADVCLLQLETPLNAVARAVHHASAAGKLAILNPAPAQELSGEHLQGLFLMTPNESETEQLTGIRPTSRQDAERAARDLMHRGALNIIITLGERGSLLVSDDGIYSIPAPAVEVVDTTGAGDAFNGALAAALSRGESLQNAARYGSCAGALAVTHKGAQPSLARHADIINLVSTLPA